MKDGRPHSIPIEDLAFAYELVCSGISWKRAAIATGHDKGKLMDSVYYVVKNGIGNEKTKQFTQAA